MEYDIRHQAGEEFAALGRRIEEMTPHIARHVQEVTALPLPATLIIRIVTVEQWMRLWARHDEQLLESETAALSPTVKEIEQARAALLFKREQHRPRAIAGQTVHYDGYASVVVLADNLRRTGEVKGEDVDTGFLCKLLAHELAHVGQNTAGGEAYRLLIRTPFPHRRPLTDRSWQFAGEGHAEWTDGQVTSRILGAPHPPSSHAGSRAASSRWGNGGMEAHVLHHILAAGSAGAVGSAQHQQTLEWYAAAKRAVSEIIAACGAQSVNRMWRQHELLPTVAEERDHVTWQRRLMGLPPRSGPSDFTAARIPGLGTRGFAVSMTPTTGRPCRPGTP